MTEKIAADKKLNHDLLQRWVAWLSDDAGSGANGNELSYLTEWRAFRKSHSEASNTAADVSSHVNQIAEQLRARAESLLPKRESLRRQFGDNFAFVAAEDRMTWDVSAEQLAGSETVEPLDAISESERQLLQSDAALLSELFDDRGVLGLAPDQIEPLLEGESATFLAQLKTRREELRKEAVAISIPMAHALAEGTARDVKIYLAGDPKKKGDVAPPRVSCDLHVGQTSAVSAFRKWAT